MRCYHTTNGYKIGGSKDKKTDKNEDNRLHLTLLS